MKAGKDKSVCQGPHYKSCIFFFLSPPPPCGRSLNIYKGTNNKVVAKYLVLECDLCLTKNTRLFVDTSTTLLLRVFFQPSTSRTPTEVRADSSN